VEAAERERWARQSYIEPFPLDYLLDARLLELLPAGLVGRFEGELDAVRLGAEPAALVDGERGEPAENRSQLAFAAKVGETPLFELGGVSYGVELF
jgi:hypothetical protein